MPLLVGGLLLLASWVSGISVAASEQIVVPLSQVATDPLIDFTPASDGSADRVSVSAAGLRVQQAADRAGSPTSANIGFKMLVPASGDFCTRLDMKVLLLEQPTEGWGQGLVYSVFLDDESQSVLQFGVLSAPGKPPRLRCERIGRHVKEPVTRYFDVALEDGTLEIRRVGREAIFSVRHGAGDFDELFRLDCSDADVRLVSVWCLRQKTGNTRADFLFRNLSIEAERFFSFQQRAGSRWSWWHLLVVVQVAVLVGLLVRYRWRH